MPGYLKFAGPVLDEATIAGVGDVLRSGHIASGPWVQKFETQLSTFCAGRPVRVLTSATAAVEVALQLCGIGPGDEVITSAESFFTVLNMIVKVGATPVFVDCDLVTRNIDLAQVEAALTPRTKAIMPTHYPGALVDLDALFALARRHGVRVIEDAALVLGSRSQRPQRRSFRRLDHVQLSSEQEHHVDRGWRAGRQRRGRGRADRDCCAFTASPTCPTDPRRGVPGGQVQPARRECAHRLRPTRAPAGVPGARRALVERYFAQLATQPACVLPPRPSGPGGDDQSWNMFCVLLPLEALTISRQAFREALEARGIGTGVSYEALHLCTLGRRYGGHAGQFPNAERIARETVSLPLHAGMTEDDVDRVCAAVEAVISAGRR